MASPAIRHVKNLVTVVTGGASGLGAAVVKRFAREGGKVCIADLPKSMGAEVALECGHDVMFVPTDVTDDKQVFDCFEECARRFGRVDNLVAFAGIANAIKVYNFKKDLPISMDEFNKVQKVNVGGTLTAVRHAIGKMAKNEPDAGGSRGAIVMAASVAAFDGQQGQVSYSASKGAIVSMTLPLARDIGLKGIRVNTVAPGVFDTPMLALLPEKVKEHLGKLPVFPDRLGHPDELAHVVQFLLENPYVNAEVVRVDGGLRMPP